MGAHFTTLSIFGSNVYYGSKHVSVTPSANNCGPGHVTEVRVAGGDVTSHRLEGLEKYTWYEVAVQPYFQSVLGRESTAQVRTLDDGDFNLLILL